MNSPNTTHTTLVSVVKITFTLLCSRKTDHSFPYNLLTAVPSDPMEQKSTLVFP